MRNFYLHLSLLITLVVLFFVSNIFIAADFNHWYFTPSLLVNVVLLVLALVLLLIGFKKRQSKEKIFYGIFISMLYVTTACILSISAFFSPLETQKYVESSSSTDSSHTLDVYFMEKEYGSYDKIIIYEKGPLWFKRLVYLEEDQSNASITWNTNDEVKINETTLSLKNHETIFIAKEK